MEVLPHLQHLDGARLRLLEWLTTLPAEREAAGIPRTKGDLALELGVAPRTLRDWQAKEDFQSAHRKEAARISGGPEKTQQVLAALFEQATDPESQKQVPAAKLWMEGTGAISPKGALPVAEGQGGDKRLKDMTMDELDAAWLAASAKRVVVDGS